jgi:hypothetical protein
MKTTHLLATLIAVATLPLTAIAGEDAGQAETAGQKQEQSFGTMEMKCMMMSGSKEQDAELDKLVAEMNSASADKRLDAVAAVVTKLVEQRKAMHEHMEKMMAEGKGMCRMMMSEDKGGGHESEHSQHH